MDKLRLIAEDIVCENFGTDPKDLKSKSRKRELIYSRACIWKMCYYFEKNLSLSKIGQWYNRDHATVLHSINITLQNLLDTDKYFKIDFLKMFDEFHYRITNKHQAFIQNIFNYNRKYLKYTYRRRLRNNHIINDY